MEFLDPRCSKVPNNLDLSYYVEWLLAYFPQETQLDDWDSDDPHVKMLFVPVRGSIPFLGIKPVVHSNGLNSILCCFCLCVLWIFSSVCLIPLHWTLFWYKPKNASGAPLHNASASSILRSLLIFSLDFKWFCIPSQGMKNITSPCSLTVALFVWHYAVIGWETDLFDPIISLRTWHEHTECSSMPQAQLVHETQNQIHLFQKLLLVTYGKIKICSICKQDALLYCAYPIYAWQAPTAMHFINVDKGHWDYITP